MDDWVRRGAGVGTLLVTAVAAGCAGTDDRPPEVDPGCTTSDCSGGTGGSGSSMAGAGGEPGAAGGAGGEPGGAGGECISDPETGTAFTGDVSVATDTSLNTGAVALYSGVVELSGRGLEGCRARTTYDGTGGSGGADGPSFVLGGLASLDQSWVFARYVSGEPEVVGSIMALDTTRDQEVFGGFWMIPSEILDSIFAEAGVTREPDRAHLLVEILDLYGPHSGAVVAVGASPVAYRGGTWSTGTGTGTDGYALVMNVPALEEPGEVVAASIDGTHQTNEFVLAAGHVTIARITYESFPGP